MNNPADAHAKQLKPTPSSSYRESHSSYNPYTYTQNDMQLRSRAASNAAKPNYVDPSSTSSEEDLEEEELLSNGEADVEKAKGKGKKRGDKKGADGKGGKGKGKGRILPQDSEAEDADDADDADEEEADMDIDDDSAQDLENEYDGDVSPAKSKNTSKGKGKAAITPHASTRRRAVRGQQPQVTPVQSPKSARKPPTPRQPRLKITLKLPQAPGSTSATPTPGVESEDIPQGRSTRAKGATTKRSAAVRSRRRIQDMDSSSEQDAPESQDDEGEDEVDVDGEGDEAEGEDDVDVEGEEPEAEDIEGDDDDMDVDMDGGASGTGAGAGAGRRLTARQAALANAVDPGHVSLDTELVDVQSLSSTKSKKKVLNETEIALRKEENARKRKNLTEKKLEDEKLETINRLLKKQTRPRAKRTGGPSGGPSGGVTPLGPLATSSTTTKAKRGGRGSGRGRGGRAGAVSRTAGDDEEEGDNMDVEEEGEAVEGEEGEGEELEGEEEKGEGQSVLGAGGMVVARGGRVVPMYRWISSVKVAGTPLVSVVDTVKKETPSEGANGKEKDVQMADATATLESKSEEKMEAQSTKQGEIEEKQEKHMALSFSVPVALLPSSSIVDSSMGSGSVSRAETPKPLATVPLSVSQDLPVRPPAATCAVDGCGVKRKYRLVSDWTKGACGMDHLKVLEGRI